MIRRADSALIRFLEDDYLPVRLLAPATAQGYRETARLFDLAAGLPRLAEIDLPLIGHFVGWLLGERRVSPQTAAKHGRQLKTILRRAAKRELLALDFGEWPQPRLIRRVPRAWRPDEFARLVSAARAMPGTVGPWPAADWWQALLLTCWTTDWRISAVMALATAQVDLARGSARGYEPKTHEERQAALVPEARDAIGRIWDPARGELFGDWPHDRTRRQWPALNRRLQQLIGAAGIPDIGRFHAIRRTACTAVAQAAGHEAAARFAGHTSARVTLAHYIDPALLPRVSAPLPRLSIDTGRPPAGGQGELF